MVTISATEAKNKLPEYMKQALREPVLIEQDGKEGVVILDKVEYERLTALEDAYWLVRAREAEANGRATDDEVQALLARYSSGG